MHGNDTQVAARKRGHIAAAAEHCNRRLRADGRLLPQDYRAQQSLSSILLFPHCPHKIILLFSAFISASARWVISPFLFQPTAALPSLFAIIPQLDDLLLTVLRRNRTTSRFSFRRYRHQRHVTYQSSDDMNLQSAPL